MKPTIHNAVTYMPLVSSSDFQTHTPLGLISHQNPEWIAVVEKCRRLKPQLSPEAYRKHKSATLPAWIPTGTFSGGHSEACRESWSGIIALDIDHIPNIPEIRRYLESLPCMYAVSLSVSGDGLFALVRVSEPERHREHWNALRTFFSNAGIVLDPQAKNPNRLRFISHDPDVYINDEALIWMELEPDPAYTRPPTPSLNSSKDLDKAINYILANRIDITQGRSKWLLIGSVFNAYYPNAEDLFVSLCQFHPSFNERECRQTFRRSCSKQTRNKGAFFNILKANGLNVKNL